MLFLNIIYVLLAISMIALILMQRGAGAQAGSGFGGGASGTVFGARGSSNFLSKSTKWLAVAFFGISLLMAWHAKENARPDPAAGGGLMSEMPAIPQAPTGGAVPAAPTGGSSVPALPAAPAPTAVPAPVQNAQPAQETAPTGG